MVRGLGLDGMANICKFSINVVRYDKPKTLRGLNQNGKWSGIGIIEFLIMDVAPSAERERPNPSSHII